ncbi:MAG TPA: hypothetical protein DCQ04_00260 [Actinobacteria bacterium]|nr:hypothetical protein [Actinomycetota bacterium]
MAGSTVTRLRAHSTGRKVADPHVIRFTAVTSGADDRGYPRHRTAVYRQIVVTLRNSLPDEELVGHRGGSRWPGVRRPLPTPRHVLRAEELGRSTG